MHEKTKLLMAISDLRGGGAEREFTGLVTHLSRDRFDVHVVLWRPVFAYSLPSDVQVHLVKKERPWDVLGAVRGFRRLITEIQPDVVFSQLHYVNMVMGTALATFGGSRPEWVCRFVNDPAREMRGPFAVWARWSVKRARLVLGASDGVGAGLIGHLSVPGSKVRSMPNAVDVAEIDRLSRLPLSHKPRGKVLVHAGRLTHQKNQALLLRAFAALDDDEVELWMLGEGELEGDLRTLSNEMGIADRVQWLGFQDNPYPYLRAADCFVLSSDHEGLPNVIIESMLCRTPVVSTDCRYGPAELIEDGKTGFLTPVGDQGALSTAIAAILADRQMGAAMAREAYRFAAERFDTQRVTAQYEALFEELVGVSS